MKIVEALGRGMGKSQAARTFSVSLSSVKRYATMAEEGRSLAPKKRPGSKPKLSERTRKPLEEDLKERPFVTLSTKVLAARGLRLVFADHPTGRSERQAGCQLSRLEFRSRH